MTRNQANVLLLVSGLAAEAAVFFALSALGVSHQMVILAALICLMVTCYMVGVIGVHYERREQERRH